MNSQLTMTGLEVWCLSICAKLLCLSSLGLSDPYNVSSIKSRNDPSPKSEVVHKTKNSVLEFSYSIHVWLAQFNKHHTSKLVMVSCKFNSRWRQFYFLLKPFKIPWCQFCVEMSDLCYMQKRRISVKQAAGKSHKVAMTFSFPLDWLDQFELKACSH